MKIVQSVTQSQVSDAMQAAEVCMFDPDLARKLRNARADVAGRLISTWRGQSEQARKRATTKLKM